MKKAKAIALTIIIGILLAATVVLYLNSYNSVLSKAGFECPTEIDRGVDDNGDEYRVIAEYPFDDGNAKVARVTKTFPGIWKLTVSEDRVSEETGTLVFGWSRFTGIGRYSTTDPIVVESERHKVYCGNNAIKKIAFPPGSLPANVTVSIRQSGSAYVLHFITFADVDTFNAIDGYDLLKNTGCIS